MKMKKKLIAGIMSMMMVVAMAVPVSATGPKPPQMEVTYTEANAYELTIPASVTLKVGEEVSETIGAESMNIEPNKELIVSIAGGVSQGEVTLHRRHGSESTTSKVSLTSGGQGIYDNARVAIFRGVDTTPAIFGTLYFAGLEDGLNAGTWTGTITFSAKVESGSN